MFRRQELREAQKLLTLLVVKYTKRNYIHWKQEKLIFGIYLQ